MPDDGFRKKWNPFTVRSREIRMMNGVNWGSHLPPFAKRACRSVRRRLAGRGRGPATESQRETLIHNVVAHPADPEDHYHLAEFYFRHGRHIAAAAECRTSLTFGGQNAKDLLSRAWAAGDFDGEGIYGLPHVVYHRVKALAARLDERLRDRQVSVLDVGGGEGFLCLFLRECEYALAEPAVNGLAIDHFPDKSFGIVTACHVFEHIPADQKKTFLERLCAVAQHAVILSGPLDTGTPRAKTTPLVYRITKAQWAKEHLDCGVPSLDLITRFAAERNMPCRVSPNGNRLAVYWAVFAAHFARHANRTDEWHEVERFANKHLDGEMANPTNPNEYLVELDLE